MLRLRTFKDIPKMQWMLVLFKLERVLLVKGKVDFDDADKILNKIDNPIRTTKNFLAEDSVYEKPILRVRDSDVVKAFLKQWRPMKR